MFTFLDWVAYQWGQYGRVFPSTKVLHGPELWNVFVGVVVQVA